MCTGILIAALFIEGKKEGKATQMSIINKMDEWYMWYMCGIVLQ